MNRVLPLTVAAVVMTVATTSQAAVMTATYTDTFSNAVYDFTETVSLTQFDSSQGTLLSVELTWSFDVDSSAGVENVSANSGVAELEQAFDIELSNSTLGTLANEGGSFSASGAVSGFDGTLDFAGTSGYTEGVTTNYAASDVFTTQSILDYFTGSGSVDFDVSGDVTITTDFLGTGVGFLTQTWNTVSDGELSVVYTYETTTQPIPSPAAVWAGLMLAGAAVMRRRNKK